MYEYFVENINGAASTQRYFYVFETEENEKVGYFAIVAMGNDTFSLLVGILERHRGNGFGADAIRQGLVIAKKLGLKKLVGKIREDNIASLKNHLKNGAVLTGAFHEEYFGADGKNYKMIEFENILE